MKTNKRGISLIVLVITIIIMIILATAIILSLQSSGIIGRSNKAKEDTDASSLKEAATLKYAEYDLKTEIGEIDITSKSADAYVKEALQNQFTEEQLGTLSISNEGKITVYTMPVIPTGFVASPYEGENTVAEGLVIYETDSLDGVEQDEAMTTYNQYVWIPVPEISEFQRIAWNNETLSYYGEYKYESSQFNAMKASVEKYGGFYIARYESGVEKIDNKDTLVIKKEATVYELAFDKNWNEENAEDTFTTYGYDTNPGCAKESKASYSNATRHLIFGVQWDAALKFMNDSTHDVRNSTTWGNYTATLESTGSNDTWKVKNVYDFAGNAAEYTYEIFRENDCACRVIRGLTANTWMEESEDFNETQSASARDIKAPGFAAGFRVALYLK